MRSLILSENMWCNCTSSLKACSRLAKFVNNFVLPQTLYIGSMKPSLSRTTIFKLFVPGIELLLAFEERENKQKDAWFQFKHWEEQDKSSDIEQQPPFRDRKHSNTLPKKKVG